jgi:hypothetical protein
MNINGKTARVVTSFCKFHQKCCLDESKRHTFMKKISFPNKYGLCTECIVLRKGNNNVPVPLLHVPGVRKLLRRNDDQEGPIIPDDLYQQRISQNDGQKGPSIPDDMRIHQNDGKKERIVPDEVTINNMIDEKAKQPNDPRPPATNDVQICLHSFNKTADPVHAMLRIQSKWRETKYDLGNDLRLYNRKCVENKAVAHIQRFFRLWRQKQNLLRHSMRKSHVDQESNSYSPMLIRQQSETNTNYFGLHDPCNNMIATNAAFILNQDTDEKGKKDQVHPPVLSCLSYTLKAPKSQKEIVFGKRCQVRACRLCNDDLACDSSERSTVTYNHHDSLPMTDLFKARSIITDYAVFSALDPFDTGQISYKNFIKTIHECWNKIGHPLLPDELYAIQDKFSCRNGYINYEEYLHFARQQLLPCRVHSRLVCTEPSCVTLLGSLETKLYCQCYQPTISNNNFCTCGKYLPYHPIQPNTSRPYTWKRGLKIFAAGDLRHTFARKTSTDYDISFNLNEFPYSTRANEGKRVVPVVFTTAVSTLCLYDCCLFHWKSLILIFNGYNRIKDRNT